MSCQHFAWKLEEVHFVLFGRCGAVTCYLRCTSAALGVSVCSQPRLEPQKHHFNGMPANHLLQLKYPSEGTMKQGAALCLRKTRGRQGSALGQGRIASLPVFCSSPCT